MRRRGKRGWNEPNGERRQRTKSVREKKKCRRKKNGATADGEIEIENRMNVREREREREKEKEKEDAMRYDKIQRDKMNWWNQVKARSYTKCSIDMNWIRAPEFQIDRSIRFFEVGVSGRRSTLGFVYVPIFIHEWRKTRTVNLWIFYIISLLFEFHTWNEYMMFQYVNKEEIQSDIG